ncbi:cation:proton antiporter [Patescibacteria group bacterium]|nr:cation:proton antiporter [Patescibacteria group bacterium]
MGKVFRTFKLPVLFGELIGGIIVGPAVLGLVSPDSETIHLLAKLGVFFLMLHAGLESDPHELLHASKKSLVVAAGGVVLPFTGGYLVAQLFGQTVPVSLFVAMCMSCTAIAISTRLFKDNKKLKTRTAHITIGAAVLDDIFALILFSVVLSLAETGDFALLPLLIILAKTVAFFFVVIIGGLRISKYMNRFLRDKGFTFTLIVGLILGLTAESIGLHMVIGAFLAGLFIREEVLDEKTFNKIEDRIYGLSYSFLGPIFFTSLAFYLDFTAITQATWFLIAVVVVAIIGKVVGAGGAALLQKIPFKQSLVIGLAMNSRGAVELIIASIGIQKGIIDQNVFSILVIMAFATTFFSIFSIRPVIKHAE